MAQSFSETSTQNVLFCTFNEVVNAGEEVVIKKTGTGSGEDVILTCTPQKPFANIIISTPELEKDSYIIEAGDQTMTIVV